MFTISEKETLDPVLESLPAKRKIKQSKPVLNCKTTQGITPEILPSGERSASKDLTIHLNSHKGQLNNLVIFCHPSDTIKFLAYALQCLHSHILSCNSSILKGAKEFISNFNITI